MESDSEGVVWRIKSLPVKLKFMTEEDVGRNNKEGVAALVEQLPRFRTCFSRNHTS